MAPGAQLMGAALNQSATNLANGLVLAAVSFRLDRRRPPLTRRAPAPTPVTRA